jgi:protein-S-isoprenylcysteine O-methyltransferase Ste14
MGGDATPWVFRRRALLIAVAFLSAALGAQLLAPFVHVALLDHATALDPRLLLGSRLPLDGAPVWQLVAPTLLIAGALLLRAWGTSYLRGHVMMDSRLHTDRLIVAGPFRWVRNPLYLGNLLFAAAFGLYLPPPGLLLAVLAMALTVAVVAAAEERALRWRYGKEYEAYAAKVSAFVPRPPPKGLPAGSPVKPDWANGLLTESWMLLVGAYLACVALRQETLGLIVLAVAVVGITASRAWQRARAKA